MLSQAAGEEVTRSGVGFWHSRESVVSTVPEILGGAAVRVVGLGRDGRGRVLNTLQLVVDGGQM